MRCTLYLSLAGSLAKISYLALKLYAFFFTSRFFSDLFETL